MRAPSARTIVSSGSASTFSVALWPHRNDIAAIYQDAAAAVPAYVAKGDWLIDAGRYLTAWPVTYSLCLCPLRGAQEKSFAHTELFRSRK